MERATATLAWRTPAESVPGNDVNGRALILEASVGNGRRAVPWAAESVPGNDGNGRAPILGPPVGNGRRAVPWASSVLADLVQAAEEEFALSLAQPQTPLRADRPAALQAPAERTERARYAFD